MLKALYDFSPISPKTLGFEVKEKLLYLSGVERDENWLRVTNRRGQIGLVPINYVDVDREMTGSAVIDFLDECLQITRREKSRFFGELLQIRKSILNPINDLERRLCEFQEVINKLKVKGSPFYNPFLYQTHKLSARQEREELGQGEQRGQQPRITSRASSFSISRISSDGQLKDETEGEEETDSHPPSFLTFEDDTGCDKLSTKQVLSCERITSSHTPTPILSLSPSSTHNDQVKEEESKKFKSKTTSCSHSCCSHHRQFIDPNSDNESQPREDVQLCDHDTDQNSISGKTSLTYICPPKQFQVPRQFQCGQKEGDRNEDLEEEKEFLANGKTRGDPERDEDGEEGVGKSEEELQQQLCEMIDLVRESTGLSDELSYKAVHSVLKYLRENIMSKAQEPTSIRKKPSSSYDTSPKLNSSIESFVVLLENSMSTSSPLHKTSSFLISSKDYERLERILLELGEQGKHDIYENWVAVNSTSLLEHDQETGGLLQEISHILRDSDERTVIKVLEQKDYEHVLDLTTYYQREHRWPRRQILIHIFAAIATIDIKALSVLLNSVLPLELAGEMMAAHFRQESQKNENGSDQRSHSTQSFVLSSNCKSSSKSSVLTFRSFQMSSWTFLTATERERLEICGSLLGLLLSTGEKLPVTHLDFLGKNFLHFVLDGIEGCGGGSGNSEGENIANVFMNLVLAYNLQFGPQDENLTVAALASRHNAKCLTQKTIHLLLWDEDPIAGCISPGNCSSCRDTAATAAAGNRAVGDGWGPTCSNSVLKLVMEMFSCAKIADLFYTNDVKVLIDIVIRSLMNWEPGELLRTQYLHLIRVIIRNSNFREHNHRQHDLVKIFTSILLEEDPLAIPDQRLIREISNEFPNLVK